MFALRTFENEQDFQASYNGQDYSDVVTAGGHWTSYTILGEETGRVDYDKKMETPQ